MSTTKNTSTSVITTLALAALLAAGVAWNLPSLETIGAAAADTAGKPAPRPVWAASATGRVEPKSGQVLIGSQMSGRIADVAVKMNDKVQAGDVVVRLDEDDLITRLSAAVAEVGVRERERDEEITKSVQLEHRQAEDAVAAAERALFRARLSFDDLAFRTRTNPGGAVTEMDKARFEISKAKDQVANSRAALARVLTKDGLPLTTRLESSLASARAELSLAEAAVERARIRAPADGTVLSVLAKFGELIAPSPDTPVVVMGDLTGLRVKAEVEERDASKVKAGQHVVVKGDAYPGQEFTGVVSDIAQSLAAPRIMTRGVRKPNDVDVIEVLVALDGQTPLLPGMRVDVFFKAEAAGSSPASGDQPATAKTN